VHQPPVARRWQLATGHTLADDPRQRGKVELILVSGYTDRLGSQQYNQKLSERRADAVKAYLVKKGVDASKIDTMGMGKTLQIKSCPDGKDRKALIECLAPNRRAVVEIKGLAK